MWCTWITFELFRETIHEAPSIARILHVNSQNHEGTATAGTVEVADEFQPSASTMRFHRDPFPNVS